ncbi:FAD-binding oxidoreductase [Periweissella ghanensis]|uniref:FAD-linked oxidoreductase n=1 Tax=Periweissella ghanensis TaxID=467997 RepID=A0ABN8BNZ4_9LACO|nr:FAD-linked oxidase C-terminal domain-containing protein [Periweissella ghanensis]MCM0600599.1 FAD-binding protein [Periweissella ghanensis]CAH0418318.1 putative FAD-linked oxidoreductase [Periweissella ghanensis]
MTVIEQQLIIPDGEVLTDAKTLAAYGLNTFSQEVTQPHQARLVVKARSIADVQATAIFCNTQKIALTVRGSGTSIVNSSAALDNGVVLDLSTLNQIIEVNIPNQYAIVEAGVLNGDLDREARKAGYFFAPDPGSKTISSIGGNIATNAGGISSLKYGTTKQSVIGLKVVLADGSLIEVGSKTFKNNVGYDLTDLFIGSEGTLGIIVEATVRLLPVPFGNPVTGLATFKNMKALSIGVQKISGSGLYPSILEALNSTSIEALDRYEHATLAKDGAQALLIFQLDVAPVGAVTALEKILKESAAIQVSVTDDPEFATKIIKIRQDYYAAENAYGRLLVEDVAVPLSKLPELAEFVESIELSSNVKAFLGGHAGDGNFHPNFAIANDLAEIPAEVTTAIHQIFEFALGLGGTISAEHGIGELKNEWLTATLGQQVVALQQQIKAVFDPHDILNTGRKVK